MRSIVFLLPIHHSRFMSSERLSAKRMVRSVLNVYDFSPR